MRIRRAVNTSFLQPSSKFPWNITPSLSCRSLDPSYSCHVLVTADMTCSPVFIAPLRPRLQGGGLNLSNIQLLEYVGRIQAQVPHSRLKMTLINARSASNKTFILNDFFTSHDLDFLFLTEMWAKVGEPTMFGELCPSNCCFISSPRSTGKGGGVAMVFKSLYKLQTISVGSYSSFELQCVLIESA